MGACALKGSHGQEKMKEPGSPPKELDQQKLLGRPSRVSIKVCQLYPEGLASRLRTRVAHFRSVLNSAEEA